MRWVWVSCGGGAVMVGGGEGWAVKLGGGQPCECPPAPVS